MPVGVLQHLPVLRGDQVGAVAVVMPGKGDDRPLRPGGLQVGGAGSPVVQVLPEPTRCGQMEQPESRRQGAAQRAQPGVPLAHIVEEGRPGQIGAARGPSGGATGAAEAMALVDHRLGPEEHGLPRTQEGGYLQLLGRRQGTASHGTKEAVAEVEDLAHQMITRSTLPIRPPMKSRAPSNTKIRANRIRKPYCDTWW